MFFLVKLLAVFPSLGNFFRGPFGKFAIGAIIVIVAFLGFRYWLFQHDERVRNELLIGYNQQQIVLMQEQQEEFDELMKQALQGQALRLKDLVEDRDRIQERADDIINRLGGLDGGDASEVLRSAVQLLKEQGSE